MCVERFLLSLMSHFGGPQELAKQWHACFAEASAMKRVRVAMAMLRLLEKFEQHDVEPESLNDGELAAEATVARARVRAELLRDDPVTAAAVAEQYGFEVTRITSLVTSE